MIVPMSPHASALTEVYAILIAAARRAAEDAAAGDLPDQAAGLIAPAMDTPDPKTAPPMPVPTAQ